MKILFRIVKIYLGEKIGEKDDFDYYQHYNNR